MRTTLIYLILVALQASACLQDLDGDDSILGQQTKEIVGGENASIANFPWQISLQDVASNHFCGGSILAREWVLTAQHCVVGLQPSDLKVVAGVSRLSDAPSSGQSVSVSAIMKFPNFASATSGKDVALLRLSGPLDLSGPNAQRIRVVTEADVGSNLADPGVVAMVTGWGRLAFGGSSPDRLQSVDVPIVSNAVAESLYGFAIGDDQLAAGDVISGGIDACQDDSGGPLVVPDGGEMILAGVVSWGIGCGDADHPGMYARVSEFEDWIHSRIPVAWKSFSVPRHGGFRITGGYNFSLHYAARTAKQFCAELGYGISEYGNFDYPAPATYTYYNGNSWSVSGHSGANLFSSISCGIVDPAYTTYVNPTRTGIRLAAGYSFQLPWKTKTADQFCVEKGHVHATGTNMTYPTGSTYTYYNGSGWSISGRADVHLFTTITCAR